MKGLQQEQQRLQSELAVVKGALTEEKELSAKRHNDLLALIAALNIKLSPPTRWDHPCHPVSPACFPTISALLF